jgi:3-ketosteroid 9alpha-monooxygenase subunit B
VVTDAPLGSHVVELQVADVVDETDDARSLVFRVPDGVPIAPEKLRYAPGQFLTLRIPSDRTGFVARCYSLCTSPFTDDAMAVTVKRTPNGYASNWLCDQARPGMKLHALAPSGTFVPTTLDADFLLLAGGSGITPVMSICKSALAKGTGKVVLIYANRNESSVIFGGTLRELAALFPNRLTTIHWLESVQGLPRAATLSTLAAPFSSHDAYICGPAPFMAAAKAALGAIGLPRKRVHSEVFRSLESDPFAAVTVDEIEDEPPARAIVALDGRRHQLRWPRDSKLLDVLLDNGLDVPFSCREGHCGACAVLKQSGEVEMEINEVLRQSDVDAGLVLACQSRPRTDAVELSYDQ